MAASRTMANISTTASDERPQGTAVISVVCPFVYGVLSQCSEMMRAWKLDRSRRQAGAAWKFGGGPQRRGEGALFQQWY
jgi:hypothetical protein